MAERAKLQQKTLSKTKNNGMVMMTSLQLLLNAQNITQPLKFVMVQPPQQRMIEFEQCMLLICCGVDVFEYYVAPYIYTSQQRFCLFYFFF